VNEKLIRSSIPLSNAERLYIETAPSFIPPAGQCDFHRITSVWYEVECDSFDTAIVWLSEIRKCMRSLLG
jgi:hypothetical protein